MLFSLWSFYDNHYFWFFKIIISIKLLLLTLWRSVDGKMKKFVFCSLLLTRDYIRLIQLLVDSIDFIHIHIHKSHIKIFQLFSSYLLLRYKLKIKSGGYRCVNKWSNQFKNQIISKSVIHSVIHSRLHWVYVQTVNIQAGGASVTLTLTKTLSKSYNKLTRFFSIKGTLISSQLLISFFFLLLPHWHQKRKIQPTIIASICHHGYKSKSWMRSQFVSCN